jgi:hypothetical protein
VTVSELSDFSKSVLKDSLSVQAYTKVRKLVIEENKNTVGLEPIRIVLRRRENIAKEEDIMSKLWKELVPKGDKLKLMVF